LRGTKSPKRKGPGGEKTLGEGRKRNFEKLQGTNLETREEEKKRERKARRIDQKKSAIRRKGGSNVGGKEKMPGKKS